MRTTTSQALSPIWDQILGTRSQVRVLRVYAADPEPLTVRELSRRAGEHLRSTQVAVERLLQLSILRTVGSGARQLIAANEQHPLHRALVQLFGAEAERDQRIIGMLRRFAAEAAPTADFVWMQEQEATLEVGLLTHSAEIDQQREALQQLLTKLMREEYLLVRLQVWTKPDLLMQGDRPPIDSLLPLIPIRGVMPPSWATQVDAGPRGKRGTRVAESVNERALRLARLVRKRPELLREARNEVQRQSETADPLQQKTLREWEQLLGATTPESFARWLLQSSEQSERLLLSLPKAFRSALNTDRKKKS